MFPAAFHHLGSRLLRMSPVTIDWVSYHHIILLCTYYIKFYYGCCYIGCSCVYARLVPLKFYPLAMSKIDWCRVLSLIPSCLGSHRNGHRILSFLIACKRGQGPYQKKTRNTPQHRPNIAHQTYVVFEFMRKAPLLSVAMNSEAQPIRPIGQDLGKKASSYCRHVTICDFIAELRGITSPSWKTMDGHGLARWACHLAGAVTVFLVLADVPSVLVCLYIRWIFQV